MFRKAPLCAFVSLSLFASQQITAKDNDKLQNKIDALIGVHNGALIPALANIPGVSDAAEAITYGTNIALKYTRAPFDAPRDVFLLPNSDDQCRYTFTLPQAEAEFKNLLGAWDTVPLPSDWGALGTPTVSHANSDVSVGVYSLERGLIEPALRQFDRSDRLIDRQLGSQSVTLPVGTTRLQWEADTQISSVFDVTLPIVAYGITNLIYGKAAVNLANTTAEQAVKQARSQLYISETLFGIGLELGLISADGLTENGIRAITHSDDEHLQEVTVYDVLDPIISTDMDSFQIEATDFGGALYSRNAAAISSTISAMDPCGRNFSLSNDAPVLLPIGTTELTWTVTDLGPNESLGSNSATLQQTILVEDTQAPIMVPPAGKVIETASTGQDAEEVMLGVPRVVDLADSQPQVSSDSPDFFPVNSRTEVLWEAADDSGNVATASQWITVKEVGSNTAPTAADRQAQTLTAEPVDIVLQGSDEDFLDGRFDPLAFKITEQPENGEFISPLFPYFIEDYRTQPEGPLGEDFLLAQPRTKFVEENYCRQNIDVPIDWVYRPSFIQVTDEGDSYVTDRYWSCIGGGNASTRNRVSKWDKDGNFLGQKQLSDNNSFPQFVLDRNGKIYFLSSNGAGTSTSLFLQPCTTDFGSNNTSCETSFKFNYSSADGLNPETLVYARVDSRNGIVFVTDKRNVYAFDIRGTVEDIEFLGSMMPDQFLRSCSAAGTSKTGFTIEIDSESNLYVLDSCDDQIHKFEASVFTSSGDFIPGDYVGWLGKCDSSTNKSCDDAKQRTKGYSCTDATCSVAQTEGDEQGQFSAPLHMALDPNDVLYVADYANQRIQRFAPDGSFAGEAASTGTGINMGDEPGFILGNFDSPRSVTVNSSQFFIVDQDESFVHVFETSPLKEITNESATVTYVSDFSFHSDTDTFKYTASDGLAISEEATVSVNVSRNFRPPTATAAELETIEDKDLIVTLVGDDPDGVIGSGDFNALDSLSYTVVTQPANGELLGSGTLFEYRPAKDFYGTDSFEFTASDGVFESDPAVVNITVEGVNDPPVIVMPELEEAGIGFPVTLVVNFTDDGIDESGDVQHEVEVSWGDGTVETNADSIEEGVLVIAPAAEGAPGLLTATHVYESTGARSVRVCVTDSLGSQSCESETLRLAELASLGMEVTTSAEELNFDEQITYEVELVNREPAISGNGLVAETVNVSHMLPQGLDFVSVTAPDASCAQTGSEISCALGDLDPGDSRLMEITAQANGFEVFDIEAEFNVAAVTDTDAVKEYFIGYAQTSLLADTTDSDDDGMPDVYEEKFGLSISSNDALLDSDFDGLSNLDEFLARTSASSNDSDGDGILDGWEVDNKLNPLSSNDAGLDADGDGFTNLEEFLADRNPIADERSGDRLVPILSDFANNILFVPAAKVGEQFFDLEFELVRSNPFVFELKSFNERAIQIEVPDASEFQTPDNLLVVPAVAAGEDNYLVELLLITQSFPFEFQLTRAEVSTLEL